MSTLLLINMSYAVFGDSYISRLERYTRGDLKCAFKCKFYGVPGMSTKRKFQDMFDRLCADRPSAAKMEDNNIFREALEGKIDKSVKRFVFINLGGNDINSKCKPAEIFSDIMQIVGELKMCGVERVFVSGILERGRFPAFTGLTQTAFNKVRRAINDRLRKKLNGDYVDMGKKLKFPIHYDSDMIHPGVPEGGMKRFKASIISCFAKTL